MTLGTVLLAFTAVAVLFSAANWYLAGRTLRLHVITHTLAEALAFTLLGTLWFASLGSGGWVLVFSLVALLVAGSERGLRFAVLRSNGAAELTNFVIAFVKILAGGGLLAYLTAP